MNIGYRYSFFLLLLLSPFIYAMFFTFPLGDDFGRALSANGLFDWYGGFHDLGLKWMRWSGRYTHHFLVIFLGDAVMSRAGYGLVCSSILSLYGIALFGIFRHIASTMRLQEHLFLALAGVVTIVTGHPALNITYYLVTDTLGIGIGNAMVLMFIYALCRLWHLPSPMRKDTAFALFCGIFAIGCYEHAALATLFSAIVALWMAHTAKHPQTDRFMLVARIVLFFFLASFFAPGNFKRQRKRDVTLERMLEQLLFASRDWASIMWQGMQSHFALYGIAVGLATRLTPRPGAHPIATPAMVATGVVALCATSAGIVVVHALSDAPVMSTHKLPASIQLLSGIAFSYIALACLGKIKGTTRKLPSSLILLPLLAVFGLSANTLTTARNILNGEIALFAATMTDRISVLTSSQQQEVRLAPLAHSPFPASLADPVPASITDWPAADIAKLYNQQMVITAAATPQEAYVLSTASGATLQWQHLPSSDIYVTLTTLTPGPNATYREHWLFVRTHVPAPRLNAMVLPVAPDYLSMPLVRHYRESLFAGDTFARRALHGWFALNRPLTLQLADSAAPELIAVDAPIRNVDATPAHNASIAVDTTMPIYAAPLGIAGRAMDALFVSIDGTTYQRIATPGL